ncbi:MAG: chromosome partitioning protein [Actinobacteria bacterium]|nr:chromosome partitioning protein [Actinomycetota bacterium]
MTALPILLGAPGLAGEPELVTALTRPGAPVTVVRRCVDAVDLLGAAASGRARVAVIGPALPRLARETVARLGSENVRVLGVAAAGDEVGRRHLRDLDVPVVSLAMDDVDAAVLSLASALDDPEAIGITPRHVDHDPVESTAGSLVAVWGPVGAPGRTTVGIALADEISRCGTTTLLVDADTYGGTVATHLGVLDDTCGIVAACRQADAGALDPAGLAAAARSITSNFRVVTGIPRADRWAELRPASLGRLWETARRMPGVCVVDAGFSLESDEDYLADTRTPRRNATTLSALAAADTIVAVASGDPVGMERFIAALPDVRRVADGRPIFVVVNRLRPGPLGRDARGQISEALARHAGVHDAVYVPDDRDAFDTCLRQGRTLAECAQRSPARGVLAEFARKLAVVSSTS